MVRGELREKEQVGPDNVRGEPTLGSPQYCPISFCNITHLWFIYIASFAIP